MRTAFVLLLMGLLLSASACSLIAAETDEDTAAVTGATVNTADRAAKIAAQGLLRSAQVAQEAYFAQSDNHAASLDQLKSVSVRVSPRIQIRKADSRGYEMSVEAEDSQRTVFILRKSAGKIERLDNQGNSW